MQTFWKVGFWENADLFFSHLHLGLAEREKDYIRLGKD